MLLRMIVHPDNQPAGRYPGFQRWRMPEVPALSEGVREADNSAVTDPDEF